MSQSNHIANIGTAEQRKRLNFGIVMLVITLIILTVFLLTGISRWWRLFLILPFYLSGTGIFQATEET